MAFLVHSPYDAAASAWLRGNLHCHTTDSDGGLSPIDTVRTYRDLGYDFLCLSEHDRPSSMDAAEAPLVLIPGVEVTANAPHVLAVGLRKPPAPDPDRRAVADAIAAAGGLSVLNHPNWGLNYNHFPQSDMEAIGTATGVEIYNGLIELLEGSPYATDRWDRLLSAGAKVWGFAHDDTHQPCTIGRGWLMVQCGERSADAILSALRRGAFYATTGAHLTSIAMADGVIRVISGDASRMRAIGQYGSELARVDGSEIAYRVTGGEGPYVRFEAHGSGGDTAWTQPFFIEAT